jgi:para-nitrobenzyl esterase
MRVFFCVTAAAAAATTRDSIRTAERASVLADISAGGPELALSNAAVRRGERYRDSLAAGRLTAGPTVTTIYGDVTGVSGGTVNQYLGVPFAAQPVGDARWKAPAKPAPWGAINATWFGKTCPQTEADTWAIFTGTDEACLNLNIYAPSKAPPPSGFPIMLFWYGGSFTYGSAGFPLYDGWFDVSLTNDTIVIASNYRLGVFGFLAGDALRNESPDGSVGTYGTMDQRAALEFIRDTAKAFGGDPTRVTIFGQSAGAASVSTHLVSPRSKGLFSGAIIESGAFSPWTAQPYNISSTRLAQFAKNVGCGAADLACMRAVNTTDALKADHDMTSAFLQWSPTIDGVEVVDDPRVLLSKGAVADVPVMLGFNADEGSMFARGPKDLNESGYVAAIATILPLAQAELVAAEYPCSAFKADLGQSACWWAIARFIRDAMFACPVQATASELATQSRNSAAKTYAYFYTQVLFIVDIVDLFKPYVSDVETVRHDENSPSPHTHMLAHYSTSYRCFHGSELPLVFDLWPAMWGEGEASMATWFASSWTNFAATGDPNYAGSPANWLPFGATNSSAVISTGAGGVVVNNTASLLTQQCAFWAANPIAESVIWG